VKLADVVPHVVPGVIAGPQVRAVVPPDVSPGQLFQGECDCSPRAAAQGSTSQGAVPLCRCRWHSSCMDLD
jgi:hypothetical protein